MSKKNSNFVSIKYGILGVLFVAVLWGPYKIQPADIRIKIVDILAPFLETLGDSFRWIEKKIFVLQDYSVNFQQLQQYRQENAILRAQQHHLDEIVIENTILKKLTHTIDIPISAFYTVKVIALPSDLRNQTCIIGAGKKHGIEKNCVALNDQGVIGRVIEVGENTSRVLLVTDHRSKIPVFVQSTREQAIVSGNNTEHPVLLYIRDVQQVKQGDVLVTSGYGGIFPRGLKIGHVLKQEDGTITVQPLNLEILEYIKIIKFLEGTDFNTMSSIHTL